jgi:hypothetical protein
MALSPTVKRSNRPGHDHQPNGASHDAIHRGLEQLLDRAQLVDMDPVATLAAKGVLALPAPVFHHRGYFRLPLTGSEDMLTPAMPILTELAPR